MPQPQIPGCSFDEEIGGKTDLILIKKFVAILLLLLVIIAATAFAFTATTARTTGATCCLACTVVRVTAVRQSVHILRSNSCTCDRYRYEQ